MRDEQRKRERRERERVCVCVCVVERKMNWVTKSQRATGREIER